MDPKQKFFDEVAKLRNAYWFIRCSRRESTVRRYYRIAKKEKASLEALGWDSELIRLYRLHLIQPWIEKREKRFLDCLEYWLYLEALVDSQTSTPDSTS